MEHAVTLAHALVLGLLAVYGLHRLWMVRVHRAIRLRAAPGDAEGPGPRPFVTVQLPLFDERTVAARAIRALGELDYPASRLEIQVLDDSTDETREIADAEVERLVRRGVAARVLRRRDRTGFKAGALALGLREARGELIAVFDADFLPRRDFLRRLVPRFQDPRVGMVQARWEHVNREDGLLTRAQAALLDGHFVIEHAVRAERGLFFNFNGTAGIWRRETIDAAGGWQHDTLTEDLDLSYRAQLAGWRFDYAPEVGTPAELPPDIGSFQSQQRRWAKGSVQVGRKLARRILAARVPLRTKLEALLHLTANAGYPLVLALALLTPLTVRWIEALPVAAHLVVFAACTLSVAAFYDRGQRALGRSARARILDVPAAMALGIGMSLVQTGAVVSGLLGATGEFVRTPKRGDARGGVPYRAVLSGLPGIELVLAAWTGWATLEAARRSMWGSLPFLMLFVVGYGWVGVLTARAARRARRERSSLGLQGQAA